MFVVFSGAPSQNMLVNFSEDHFIMQEPGAVQLLKIFPPDGTLSTSYMSYYKGPGPSVLILWINHENVSSDADQ